MSKDLIYFLLLIVPIVPAFVVLTRDTDLPKEKEKWWISPSRKG